MTRREVVGRYRGSVAGLAWSFLHPLMMLAVYTFFFSVVFKARWGSGGGAESENRPMFALLLFIGLIVHGFFSEVVNRAPTLLLNHANYVKKVVFPLEILPVVTLGSAIFHAAASVLVLLAAIAVFGQLHLTVLLMPLVLLPVALFALGLGLFLASLGVYLRDVSQTMGLLTTLLLFMSPVFYPVEALPPRLQPLMLLNPLTIVIEQARAVVIWGRMPNFLQLAVHVLVSLSVTWAGYAWFQRTRRGFSDVL